MKIIMEFDGEQDVKDFCKKMAHTIVEEMKRYKKEEKCKKHSGKSLYSMDRGLYIFDPIRFTHYENAKMVLDGLRKQLEFNGRITAQDYYKMCGKDSYDPGDFRRGWTDLSKVVVQYDTTASAWKLTLPEPQLLEEQT